MSDKRKKKQRARKITLSEMERSTLAKRRSSMWDNGSEESRIESNPRRLSVYDPGRKTTIHRKKRSIENNISRRKSVLDGAAYSRRKSILECNDSRRKSIFDGGESRRKSVFEYAESRRKSIFEGTESNDSRRKSIYEFANLDSPSITRRKSIYPDGDNPMLSRRREPTFDPDNPSLTRRRQYNYDPDNPLLSRRKSCYPDGDNPLLSRRKSVYPDGENPSLSRRREFIPDAEMSSVNRRREYFGDGEVGSVNRRRRLSDFYPEPSDDDEFDTDEEERELYRKTFLEPENETVDSSSSRNKVEYRNRFSKMIAFLAIEHEILLQVLMVLPLTLMALYIALIEGGPLIRVIEND